LATATATIESRSGTGGRKDPLAIRVYSAAVVVAFVALLLLAWSSGSNSLVPDAKTIVWFTLAAQAAELLRVQLWPEMSFSLALPVLLAAGMILPPWQAAGVAFVGSVDLLDIRRRIPASRIAFNAAEVGLSVMGASAVFHALADGRLDWPFILFPSLAAFATDAFLNAALVVWPASYLQAVRPADAVRRMFGPNLSYLIRYVGIGLMAPLIATIWLHSGVVGLAAFFFPLALAWSAYRQAERLSEISRQLSDKNSSLLAALEQVAAERRDERLALAGGLHDKVLPALFKVDLMAQVLRRDLADGRLLDLEADLPPLTEAASLAMHATRELTNDLRESSLGPGGLAAALRSIAAELESASTTRFDLDLADVVAEETTQLVTYQVGREAMINASKHSQADRVTVRLNVDAGGIRLTVSDEGVGFSTRVASKPLHFGLQLMAERADAAGGRLTVDSMIGHGTTVSLVLPARKGAR
jgi:signal transduction histidine kinase